MTPLRVVSALALVLTLASGSRAYAQVAHVEPIINGRTATAMEMLGTVGVLDASTLAVSCTGTLVSKRVVITAGHCFFDYEGHPIDATSLVVAIGLLDLRDTPSAEHMVAVVSGGPHPDYGNDRMGDERASGLDPTERDIGVLVLARDVVEQAPVALASTRETDAVTTVDSVVSLVGYGVSDLQTGDFGVLMRVDSTVIDRLANELLIAPATSAEGDTCFGDSGGPVYAIVDGSPALIGLTSRGRIDSDLDCGDGGIYTTVAFHREFIAEISGDETLGPPPHASGGRCEVAPMFGGQTSVASLALLAAIALAITSLARRRFRDS